MSMTSTRPAKRLYRVNSYYSLVFLTLLSSTLLAVQPANSVPNKTKDSAKSTCSGKALPSQFDLDKSEKFDEKKWRSLTEQGIEALDKKMMQSAEQFFQAAVREASKASDMSPYMIDSLVHTSEVYRLTKRTAEAKESLEQASMLLKCLVAEKCPLCEETKSSVPMLYAPHTEELEAWVKDQQVRLADFKSVTQPRKQRPVWYCMQCEKAY